MDALTAAAARALAGGDAITALNHVALRDDPPALALRGIAMAQLGELPRARELLRRAARAFGDHEAAARARCVVAEAEVALAMRDLTGAARGLAEAAATLDARGVRGDRTDRANARHARLLAARRALLLGRLDEAARALAAAGNDGGPPALDAVAALVSAELALRTLQVPPAARALARARESAARAGIPALQAEVAEAQAALGRPAARRLDGGRWRLLRLDEVAALGEGRAVVVDACRLALRHGSEVRSLARRPVLFALLHALAAAWPGDVAREDLIAHAFRTRHPDETHRARLRVEIGRLRALARGLAAVDATARGFVLRADGAGDGDSDGDGDAAGVVLLAPPLDGASAALQALLADGAAWSTSALALALGASQRSVQRALAVLQAEGRVRAVGRARAQRWVAPPLAGFATILLLPASLPPA